MKLIILLAIFAALFLAPAPAVAEVIAQGDQEVQVIAEPVLDGVLAGFNDGNYELYAKYFDDLLKEAVPEKKFRQVRADILKNLGKYRSRTYLGFLSKNQTTVVLWKGRFSGSTDEALIKLSLSRRGDRIVVTGLWFQ